MKRFWRKNAWLLVSVLVLGGGASTGFAALANPGIGPPPSPDGSPPPPRGPVPPPDPCPPPPTVTCGGGYGWWGPPCGVRWGPFYMPCECVSSGGASASSSASGTIYVDRGEERYTAMDLYIRGRGFDWFHTRYYNSRWQLDTPMGIGWTHGYFDFIRVTPDNTSTNIDDNDLRAFAGVQAGATARFDDWEVVSVDTNGTVSYKLIDSGIFQNMQRLDTNGTPSDITDDTFVLINELGEKREYAQVVTNTSVGGTVAFLTVIEDPVGNRLDLFYEDTNRPTLLTRVNDTLGRDIAYAYYDSTDSISNRANRLKTITDFKGRVLSYDYDSNGDLIEAIGPAVTNTVTGNDFPDGKKETYTYSTNFTEPFLNHNILSVVRPNENNTEFGLPPDGTPALQWTYDSIDRVATHTVGASNVTGSAGGTYQYSYEPLTGQPGDFDAGVEDSAYLKVTEIDRNGNRRDYSFTPLSIRTRFELFTRGLRAGEPEKYMVRHKVNSDFQYTGADYADGNSSQFLTDSSNTDFRQRSNVLETRSMPDPIRGGAQTQLLTRIVYDPFYNQPCLTIDPRGTDTNFVPPNGGMTSPMRYAKRYVFDYQEGPDNDTHKQLLADKFGLTLDEVKSIITNNEAQVEAALGMAPGTFTLLGRGDLNGDGVTNQIGGKRIVETSPSVLLLPDSNQADLLGTTTQKIQKIFIYDDNGLILTKIDAEGNVTDYEYFPASDPNGDGDTNEVAVVKGVNGYLKKITQDGRELTNVVTRTATGNGIGFANVITTYERDVVGNITVTTDPDACACQGTLGYTNIYNELDQVIRTIAPAPYNYTRDTIYDANDNVVEIRIENKVPALTDERPSFDASGNITLTSGTPTEFLNLYEFDILDNKIKDDIDAINSTPANLVTTYEFDANENQILITKPEGNKIKTEYDERDLVFKVITGFGSPDASTNTYNYDKNANLIEIVDSQDNNGDGEPESTLYSFDGYDRMTNKVDAVGNVCAYLLDPANNRIQEDCFGVVSGPSPTNNSGAGNVLLEQTKWQFDEINRTYQTDLLLAVAAGTPTNRSVTLKDGSLSPNDGFVSARTEYDANSRVTFMVEDDEDVAQTIIYDGILRQAKVTDAESNVVEYIYDKSSNIISMKETDKSQHPAFPDEIIITTNIFDVLNRLTITIDNVGNTNRMAYDSRDNRTDAIDAEGNTTHYIFDGANRIIEEVADLRVDGTGATAIDTSQSGDGKITVKREWDGNSRLRALIDDNGNRTLWTYNDLDRRTNCTYGIVVSPSLADTNTGSTDESWTYDRDHNITSFTDQNGSTFDSSFDGINRRTNVAVTFASGNPHNLSGTTNQAFDFDGLSRLVQCTDNNQPSDTNDDVTCSFAYDTISRKIEETHQIGSLPVRVNSYNYDESLAIAGNLDITSMIFPDGRECEYEYDDNNRLKVIHDKGFDPIIEYEYIGRNYRVIRKDLQNGVFTTNTYDGIRRILRLDTFSGTNRIAGFERGYDREDNALFEEKLHDVGNSEVYDYDSAYRIIDFDRGYLNPARTTVTNVTGTTGALQTKTWTFDGPGNWDTNTFTFQSASAVTQSRKDSNFNELDQAQNGTNLSVAFDYDDNGNQLVLHSIGEGGTTNTDFILEWDAFNRLRKITRMSDTNVVAEYTYACDNKRMRRVVTNSASLDETRDFYYSGWRVCEEHVVTGGVEQIDRQYVWGATYLDELIVRDDRDGVAVSNLNDGVGSEREFQHANSMFSIHAVTDEGASVLERAQFDPFGNITVMDASFTVITNTAIDQEYSFEGQRFDGETTLFYFKNRYYSSSQGRFILRDPLRRALKGPLYVFNRNTPPNRIDTLGLLSGTLPGTAEERDCIRCATDGKGLGTIIMIRDLAMSASDDLGDAMHRAFPGHVRRDLVNALRHCVGACMLTASFGPTVAWDIEECHEDSSSLTSDTVADRHNNAEGNRLGNSSPEMTPSACGDLCLQSMGGERLIIDR